MAVAFAVNRGALPRCCPVNNRASQIEAEVAASRALGQGAALLGKFASPAIRESAFHDVDANRHIKRRRKRQLACRAAGASNAEKTVARSEDRIELGKTGLQVSPVGIGTLQWGDPGSGFGDSYDEETLKEVFDTAAEGGISFFDTAEVYGYESIKKGQSSEQLVGRFTKSLPAGKPAPVVATKFFTIPWTNLLVGGGFRFGRKSMIAALKESLKRLGKDKVDLYQIHFPFPTFSNSTLMDGLKEVRDLGLADAVGVSNYSLAQMEDAHSLLDKHGIPLASNQVQYSLLSRAPDKSGLLEKAKDLGVSVIAYQPLASGKLTQRQLERGEQGSELRPLLQLMSFIGAVNGGKSVTQVALNYLVCKGAIPIPGCKSVVQAKEHVGALGWRLDENEVATIEEKLASLSL
ncbi:hypothetical protein KFL_004740010 [Klebsormidium nitens]|uniref:NADP-dependent oxidoreductase domain-containing protein n=1 Tax=Klebsormidium nitens TaxID=105231 RepID=A0A1Y1IIN6_KLENI|nr:hypothetical protein KFL_004740010 [Klebsormidium nitens]|eukprot:GAQ88961.1 hypothetical protein KFL_004740010 [Klebsormidium nitens]